MHQGHLDSPIIQRPLQKMSGKLISSIRRFHACGSLFQKSYDAQAKLNYALNATRLASIIAHGDQYMAFTVRKKFAG